jgi:hypothetical protein
MAARIQAKINAPCKENKCVPSVTVEHIEHIGQPLPERASQPPAQQPKLAQQGSSSDTSELAPFRLEHRGKMVAAEPKADSNRSKTRARSDSNENDSDDSFHFTSSMHTDSGANLTRARNNRSKRQRLHTGSPEQDLEVTSTAGANLPSDITTDITIPDDNNNNIDLDEGGLSQLSGTDEMKRKLQLDLTRFLNKELDYAGILREVVPPTRDLYAISPHHTPCSDLEFEFKNFNRALDHWEGLIETRTASPHVTPTPLKDPLQELTAQGTFEDYIAALRNLGPRSHIDFPLERLTVFLAMCFEGLLGNTYIPVPSGDLVIQLRAVNRSLYDTIHCSESSK